MKPNDAYILGQRDRYRRDREPDIKCRNCGQPWAIEAEGAAAPTSEPLREALVLLQQVNPRAALGGAALDALLFDIRKFLNSQAAAPPPAQPAEPAGGVLAQIESLPWPELIALRGVIEDRITRLMRERQP